MILTQGSEAVKPSDRPRSTLIDRLLLRQVSPRDAKFDDRRAEADRLRELYSGTILDPLAGRIRECSGQLEFAYDVGEDNLPKLKLRSARFCRVRTCPVCQWRRSLMWRAKAFKILPQVVVAYPKHRWVFLTLTVRNCQVGELRATLDKMGKAWRRMTARKQWPAIGWIRSVEVTRGAGDTVHPHYHCLLLVKPSYFAGHSYLSQEAWTDLWQASLQIDYKPIVHVAAVKPKHNGEPDTLRAILETLKYTVKPSDLLGDSEQETTDNDSEWLVNLTLQLHKTRSVATGGILKEYLKELEQEPEDLIHCDEEGETDDSGLASVTFNWEQEIKRYLLADDGE